MFDDEVKLWYYLKEMGIPDHLTCLLRNLYAGQEATVRTGHGITDCSADTNHAAQQAILMELSRQESHSSAGKDQGAEQTAIKWLRRL